MIFHHLHFFISQAARSGHKEVVMLLVKHGVGINERTDFGQGQSVLNVAYDHHDEDSSFIDFLINEMGAIDIDGEEEL